MKKKNHRLRKKEEREEKSEKRDSKEKRNENIHGCRNKGRTKEERRGCDKMKKEE